MKFSWGRCSSGRVLCIEQKERKKEGGLSLKHATCQRCLREPCVRGRYSSEQAEEKVAELSKQAGILEQPGL